MAIALADHEPIAASRLLGLEHLLASDPINTFEWISLIRTGLPSTSIDALVHQTRIPLSELARALALSERTLSRRKSEGKALSPDESTKLVRLARVVERAQQVFEDHALALDWLTHVNDALGGASPLSLLDTEIGADSVLDTLGRIEQGIFS